MPKELTASMEDYLENIYLLVRKNKVARAKEIADKLKVKKPSVTGALKVLSNLGLIKHNPYGYIDLTLKGREKAAKIFKRHGILKDFFLSVLRMDEEMAEKDACRIEHAISDKTLDKMVQFIDFIENCPVGGKGWIESFHEYCAKKITGKFCVTGLKRPGLKSSRLKRKKNELKRNHVANKTGDVFVR